MDIIIYVTILTICGFINCYKHNNLNFEERTLEQIQPDVGDESLGEVSRVEIPVGNNLENIYHEQAFMRIVKELGLL